MDQHWQNRENGEITSHDYETDERITGREKRLMVVIQYWSTTRISSLKSGRHRLVFFTD
jgi:hypothetical protein